MAWEDPTTSIQSDLPIRASDIRKIQANIASVAAGDTGAPRIAVDLAGQTALGTDLANPAGLAAETDGAGSFHLVGSRQAYYQTGMSGPAGGGVLGASSPGTVRMDTGTPAITYEDGVFTVPSPGLYLVAAAATLSDTTESIYLEVNAGAGWNALVGALAVSESGPSSGSIVGRVMLVIPMSAGDQVRVNTTGGALYDVTQGAVQVSRV